MDPQVDPQVDPPSDMCMLHGRGGTNGSLGGPSFRHVRVAWAENRVVTDGSLGPLVRHVHVAWQGGGG